MANLPFKLFYKHYFRKKSENERVGHMFNLIAPVYDRFDLFIKNNFQKSFEEIQKIISVSGKTVLDVGCGTGGWSYHFMTHGAKVTGIDLSEKMIRLAQNRYGAQMECHEVLTKDDSPFWEENQYDIVTASYVLHGMNREERYSLLKKMKQSARKAVIIHDYSHKFAGIIMYFLEVLERSDYTYFRKNFADEFTALYPKGKIYYPRESSALYFSEV